MCKSFFLENGRIEMSILNTVYTWYTQGGFFLPILSGSFPMCDSCFDPIMTNHYFKEEIAKRKTTNL